MNSKFLLIAAICSSPFFTKVNNGEDVIKLMYKKYAGKWSRTLTFDQTTEIYRDTSKKVQTWHESILYPDKLRIDIEPVADENAAIYRGDSTYSIRNGNLHAASANENDFIFLLGGMYFYPLDKTIERLTTRGYDLSKMGEDTLNGKPVYIVGASARNEQVSQLWIEKDDLYLVRMIKYNKKSKFDAICGSYIKIGKGATETKVTFYVNDKLRQVETYYNCKLAPDIDPGIFDPQHYKKIIYKN